jgi:hypothetical protein
MWYIIAKNVSFLKMNQYMKIGWIDCSRYPQWTNGVLFYHLDQRHFFTSSLIGQKIDGLLSSSGSELPQLGISRIISYEGLDQVNEAVERQEKQ